MSTEPAFHSTSTMNLHDSTRRSGATERKYRVPALEKGLDILELLARAPQPMSLVEISKGLGRSSSEVFRMIDCLEKRGFLIKDPASGNYRLSLRLFELAHVHVPVAALLDAANVPMQRLAADIQESAHLSVLSGGAVLVLVEWPTPEKIRIAVEAGACQHALYTVSGRLLVALMEPAQQDLFLESSSDFQAMSDRKKREMRKTLEAIAANGYSEAPSEVHPGIQDLAMPVGNAHIGLFASLAVTRWEDPREPNKRDLVFTKMQACARQITESLGLTYRQ